MSKQNDLHIIEAIARRHTENMHRQHPRAPHTPPESHPYGALIGSPMEAMLQGASHSPHYQIHLKTEEENPDYRIAVNVLSDQPPHNLLYHVNDHFTYPTLPDLLSLAQQSRGFTALDRPNPLALDFLRTDIVDQTHMTPVPFTEQGSVTVLKDLLDTRIREAIDDPDALLFAFGRRWGPEDGQPDQVFKFDPGQGIHDIHMNQGSSGSHKNENGIYQDGALLLYFPSRQTWTALFLMFQSQSIETDCSGNPAPQLVMCD
jgi:uncharacterized protein YukJ